MCYVAFTRAKDGLFLSDAAGTNYDGSFRLPSRFLFNAEGENITYAVPLDPDLEERAMEQIRKTETTERPAQSQTRTGGRILHAIFGEGTIIGTPRDSQGIIVQFDSIPTPRTFGPSANITYL